MCFDLKSLVHVSRYLVIEQRNSKKNIACALPNLWMEIARSILKLYISERYGTGKKHKDDCFSSFPVPAMRVDLNSLGFLNRKKFSSN